MISVRACYGCAYWTPYIDIGSPVKSPCHECYLTSSGWPSNYAPQPITVTSQNENMSNDHKEE